MSKLILGTVQFGLDYGINNPYGKPALNQVFDILNTAYDNGVNILDTAEAYGNSQEIIGAYHSAFPDKKFKIITKFSGENENINLKIKENCNILNVESLYAYMFHNFSAFENHKEKYKELLNAKEKGLIQKTGISLYTNNEIDYLLKNNYLFDIIQVPFNLLDNAKQREAMFLKAKEKGIEIHTRSAFLQGVFFMKDNTFQKQIKLFDEIEQLKQISNVSGIDLATMALQYVWQKDYINHLVIGVDNATQLKNNLSSLNKKVTIPHKKIDAITVKNTEMLNPSNWKK